MVPTLAVTRRPQQPSDMIAVLASRNGKREREREVGEGRRWMEVLIYRQREREREREREMRKRKRKIDRERRERRERGETGTERDPIKRLRQKSQKKPSKKRGDLCICVSV